MVDGGRIAPVVINARGDVVGLRMTLDNLVEPFFQKRAHIGFEAADGGAEHRLFGDDVRGGAGVDLRHRK